MEASSFFTSTSRPAVPHQSAPEAPAGPCSPDCASSLGSLPLRVSLFSRSQASSGPLVAELWMQQKSPQRLFIPRVRPHSDLEEGKRRASETNHESLHLITFQQSCGWTLSHSLLNVAEQHTLKPGTDSETHRAGSTLLHSPVPPEQVMEPL